MSVERNLDWTDLLALAEEVKTESEPGSKTWIADDSTTQQVNEKVMKVLRQNSGTIPGELGTIPCLILTTTGANSGEPRTVPLFSHTVDGRLAIIGSMGGAARNPPWYYNLVKNPTVIESWPRKTEHEYKWDLRAPSTA